MLANSIQALFRLTNDSLMKHTAPPKTNIVYLQNAGLNSCYKVINIFVQYNGIIPLMVFKSAVYFFVWRY